MSSTSSRWITLLEIRKLLGISQTELARELGVHHSSIARVEAGVPALSAEYIHKLCVMLSINETFLYEKSDYPFLPKSFLVFKVRGLSSRLRPLSWLDLLMKYSRGLKVLLLLRRKTDNVVTACVKDYRDSLFLVSIEFPLPFKNVFEHVGKQPEEKILLHAKEFFDRLNVLSPLRSFEDIAHYPRKMIDSMIEEAFEDVLSEKEKELIRTIRRNKIPVEKMIEQAKKEWSFSTRQIKSETGAGRKA